MVAALLGSALAVVPATDALAAQGATALTVTTTTDTSPTGGACAGHSIVTAPSPLSLRDALCLADNINWNNPGSPVAINLAAATYQATNGQFEVATTAGANLSVLGQGADATAITSSNNSRVLDLDPNHLGGTTVSVGSLGISGAYLSSGGGGAIRGGSSSASSADSLTLSGVRVNGNYSAATDGSGAGGGVQFVGGTLLISSSTFNANVTTNSNEGSALFYKATGATANEQLRVNGTAFTGNSTNANSGSAISGGALSVNGPDMVLDQDTFSSNTSNATTGVGTAGAIWQRGGTLTVTRSNLVSNQVRDGSGTGSGGAITVDAGRLNLYYSRINPNYATAANAIATGSNVVDATNDWWGTSGGPNTYSNGTTTGTAINAVPRLVITGGSTPSTIVGPGTSTITDSLLKNSAGTALDPANLSAFAAVSSYFQMGGTTNAKLSVPSAPFVNGVASSTMTSNDSSGQQYIYLSLDSQTALAYVNVNTAPAITSAVSASFSAGQPGSFTVTTTGYPAPTITRSGSLPAGMTF